MTAQEALDLADVMLRAEGAPQLTEREYKRERAKLAVKLIKSAVPWLGGR